MGTRLQYDYGFQLGPNMAAFDLIEREDGQQALNELYRGDIEVAQEHHVPIIINTATFRASKNHLCSRGFNKVSDVKRINIECVDFLKIIRDSYDHPNIPIFIGTALGSMHDSYGTETPPNVETAKQYHMNKLTFSKKQTEEFHYKNSLKTDS